MHLAKSGRLIVKLISASSGIRAGELLVDSAGRRVGKVMELIGPVSAPYASVVSMTDRTGRLVGTKVFSGGVAASSRKQRGRGSSARDSKARRQ